jgi:hypothetical protein
MNNQYFLARLTGRDPDLRASDADREEAAGRLRKGHAEGRLDLAEFQERLERCYESKTIGQLSALVGDLPRPVEPQNTSRLASLSPARWPLLPILIALFVVAGAAGGHHVFWLWLPVAFVVWRMTSWRRRHRWASARRGPDSWI